MLLREWQMPGCGRGQGKNDDFGLIVPHLAMFPSNPFKNLNLFETPDKLVNYTNYNIYIWKSFTCGLGSKPQR